MGSESGTWRFALSLRGKLLAFVFAVSAVFALGT
jgi:hypothetical protein